MKKLVFVLAVMFMTAPAIAQKKNAVEEFNFSAATKGDYKSYKNGFDVTNLITDFGTFKIGDALIVDKPSDPLLNDFTWIMIGKYSVMNAMTAVKLSRAMSNKEVLIDRIRVYKPAMGTPATIVMDIISPDGSNLGGIYKRGAIFNLERAISTGEIPNPNAPLTREQAIAKLKEAKDLLELDMMSQEKFDALKAELTPIIRGN